MLKDKTKHKFDFFNLKFFYLDKVEYGKLKNIYYDNCISN